MPDSTSSSDIPSDPENSGKPPEGVAGSEGSPSSLSGQKPSVPLTLKMTMPISGDGEGGPVFFNIPGKKPSEGVSSGPGLLESASSPSLEDIPPELPVNAGAVSQVDPEFDSLPGLESQGSKFGFWALILGVFGVVVGLISFGGGLNLRIALGLGLIGLLLGVVSFFKQPRVVKSVIGVGLCLLVAAGAGFGLFVLSAAKAAERLAQNTLEAAFDPTKAPAGLPAEVLSASGVSSGESESSEASEVPVLDEGAALVVVPPELRPVPEPEVEELSPYGDAGALLPPEARAPEIIVREDDQLIGALWLEAEKGVLPGANDFERRLAWRVAEFVGYPLEVYSGFSPELRLYVLRQAVLNSGVDLADFRERSVQTVSSSLYSPGGVGGQGAGGLAGGPGPLPFAQVSSSDLPIERVRGILEERSYGTPSDGVGKFMVGSTAVQIRSLLDEARSIGISRNEPSGKEVYEARFGRQVGWDASGLASTRIRLIFDGEGALEDAYPY